MNATPTSLRPSIGPATAETVEINARVGFSRLSDGSKTYKAIIEQPEESRRIVVECLDEARSITLCGDILRAVRKATLIEPDPDMVALFGFAAGLTNRRAVEVRQESMAPAAFCRFCLSSSLSADDVLANIPEESRPAFLLIAAAARELLEVEEAKGALCDFSRLSKLAGLKQWALESWEAQ